MRRLLHALPALLLTAALPSSGWADMTAEDREEFREEVRAYLLENPEILTEMVSILETRQADAAETLDGDRIAAQASALFEDGFSFVGGAAEGDVTVVEFLDYQCGYCRKAHPEFTELLESDGNIRWIVKELPILGPGSVLAARAAIATLIGQGPEAYARLNDTLLRSEGPINDASLDAALREAGLDPAAVRAGMEDPEVTRRLEATRALAAELEIQGTPAFVFGDRMLRGFAPVAAMEALVAEARAGE
jgi:protein-disulfide isomerase